MAIRDQNDGRFDAAADRERPSTPLRVLKHGRGGATRFDTSASPLAAYLYERMGTAGIADQIDRGRLVHAGKQEQPDDTQTQP